MSLQVHGLPDGGKLYVSDKGRMQTHHLGGGVLLHTRSGFIDDEFSEVVRDECDRQMASFGKCILMVDATLTTKHSTRFREDMTLWFHDNPDAEVHVLTRSSMVRMAVTVATLGGSGMAAYTYEEEAMWLAVGMRYSAGFRRIPLQLPKS